MKKWKKVLIIILIILALGTALGVISYRVFLKPTVDKKIEQTVQKAQQVVQDDSIQKIIEDVANEMIDDGVLKAEDIPGFVQYSTQRREAKSQEEQKNAENQSNTAPQDNSSETKKNSNTESGKNNEASSNNVSSKTDDVKSSTESESSQAQGTFKDVQNAVQSESVAEQPKTVEEKVMDVMEPDELAFAMSIYGKIDIGHAMSLMETDRKAAKEYVYERVSSDEIARCFEIYAKYAYLLG